jgi:ubiquinone/menaquinone biosynthesis C-methylase UbiE
VPDVWSTINTSDEALLERLAITLEARAADPQQQQMLRSYLSEIAFPDDARVLEIGCGTGAVTQTLATWPGVGQVTGIDPSPAFIDRARTLRGDIANLSFQTGDGRALTFADESFDVVVFHTILTHAPEPQELIGEAFRVLRPNGTLAVFDGDFPTATVAIGNFDPLEACIEAVIDVSAHDPWLVRKLPRLVSASGFIPGRMNGYSYLEAATPGYFLGVFERGVDSLVLAGRISAATATALKAEAQRRGECGEWFGHLAFASLIARKPAALQ